jgi:peptide deformylase
MVHEIVKFGSKALRATCAPIAAYDDEVVALVTNLFDSMRAAEGVGLAAPQIGILRRVAIVDVSPQVPTAPPVVLVNPRLVKTEGTQIGEEGCLSFPGLYGDVERFERVTVESWGEDGSPFTVEAEGFFARALQHEIDHLDGKLFIERLSPLKRQLMRGALKKLKKEGEQWDRLHRK